MKKETAPLLLVDDVLKQIKEELNIKEQDDNITLDINLSDKKQKSKLFLVAKKIGRYLQKKGFYKFVALVQNSLNLHKENYVYTIDDFIHYSDVKFIENAYKLILKRIPDKEEKEYYLSSLRYGRLSKKQIVALLHFSREGRKQNVIIKGSFKIYFITLLYKTPIIGYVFELLVNILRLPKLIQRIRQLEKQVGENNQIINTKANYEHIKNLQNYFEEALNTKADFQQMQNLKMMFTEKVENYSKTVDYAKEYMKIASENIQTLINEAKKNLSDTVKTQNIASLLTEEEQHKYDALYVEFEDKFRGTRTDIKNRVSIYLPYLEKLPFQKENIYILDVGCGRGEWLELLKESGYTNVQGVDLNRIMVSTAKNLGLNVKNIDAITYLKTLEENSLTVITGFHVIEHLSFDALMEMFKESFRVLKKGGMIIFETPNPENILVGAHYFYTDPTHINPLVPSTTQFLVEYNGFKNIEIKRLHKYNENIDLNSNFIQRHFKNEMDYAIIGYKV